MHKKGYSLRSILALLALGTASALQASVPSGSIDDFIAAEMPHSGAPGLAYAVVEDGAVHAEARGNVRIGSSRKVTPDTPFLLGSISKSFTAIAVMQLVEAGKVQLDTGISHYLDAFADRPSGAITIRQLLSHTSGYSTLQGNQTHAGLTGNTDGIALQAGRIAQWTPAHKPGIKWEYSNANYEILGALIETVSGMPYARYIETKILQPAGMEHSFVADGQSHDAMAVGHRPWFGSRRPLENTRTDPVTAPQGGVIASVRDLARYLAIMMNGNDDILSAKAKAEMMRPASAASPFYGFGWFIDTEKGTVFHSGSSPGFETLATMIPAKNKGVVVLVNAGSGIGFGETAGLRNGITALALGLDYAGEGNRLQQKALFVGLVLLPPVFLFSMVWAWLHRGALRAKSGPFGLFSLWFPLLTTLAMAWTFFFLIPRLFGVSIGTLRLFQPDLALIMTAAAATGVMWALFRLAVAYTGANRA
ncbi:MAG TPA: serine hydrolase domain-containing protein [Terracidiphilus sp.]|nr:serine hydrolase domain-containing protein [Terracidiphilus sp.]